MKERKTIHDNWKTPEKLINNIKKTYFNNNDFFDPCPLNNDLTKFNGLNVDWKQYNFINPPYNRKDKELFIRKAFEESKKNKVCVLLLPVSTSTKIFHEIIYPNCDLVFIEKRIKFEGINSYGKLVSNKCGMHDSMLCIFR
jgi:hypothetical protein